LPLVIALDELRRLIRTHWPQFTREYARQFGEPPRRDADRLRATPVRSVGAGHEIPGM